MKNFVFNYPKFFIRNEFNNVGVILDNSLEVSTNIKDKSINVQGYSIILNKTLYAHKFYKNLKFYWFNPNIYLNQKIYSYLNNSNLKHYLFLTRITKGGVESYSNGFKGVLPKNQFFSLTKLVGMPFLSSKVNFFVNLKKNSKFILFKAPVELLKITAHPTQFSSLSTKRTSNKLNIIFSYSNKLVTYENKKINKKNRKYNSKKKY